MLFGKYINPYYKKYWYYFLAVFLCDAIIDVTQLFIPKIIGSIVKKFDEGTFIFAASETVMWYQTDFAKVMFSIFIITIILVLGRMSWRYLSSRIAAKIERDLRSEMFRHIQTLSLNFYGQKNVGALMSYFTNDLETIKMFFADGLIFFTDFVVLGTASFIFMALINWQIALYITIPLFIFIFLGGAVGKGESKRFKLSNDSFEDLSNFTEENLQGFSVIKAYLKERDRKKKFESLTRTNEKKAVDYLRYSSLINGGINFLLSITFFILFVLCSMVLFNSETSLGGGFTSTGDLMEFSGYYEALIWPMIAGGMLIDLISRGRAAHRRISEIFDTKADIPDDPEAVKRDSISGDIRANHLSFAYPDNPEVPVLKDLSFDIKAGQIVGIVGRTGSGKSTLVSLFSKLYAVEEGMLQIDGVDSTKWRKDDLRNRIGFVQQQGFLFSGTIKENIAFCDDHVKDISLDRVKKAAEFSDIAKDIELFPLRYDTPVGERGATLSGGQRQRVTLARAYYKQADMYILDDSLSAVDADTEKIIMEHIRSFEKKTTTFIITHRISSVEDCDWILVMDRGEIIDQGRHDELKERCPFYQELCSLQALEKEVEG